MTDRGYGVVTLDEREWTSAPDSPGMSSLTETLGCRHTSVTAYRFSGGESLDLPAVDEQLCIPIGAHEPLELADAVTLPTDGLLLVPAGVSATLTSGDSVSLVVVAAGASPAPDAEPRTLSLDDYAFTPPETSDIPTARLTRALGCRGMKVNARLLEPGDVVPYHTEGDQEELFVPVAGPAAMRIADTTDETPPGAVARVAPEVPRSAVNDGDADTRWVMVGAPPTGGPDEWDPGAEILE